MRFDPATRRLVREGVPGEVSGFDLRALGAAVALRAQHGGEVVALTDGAAGRARRAWSSVWRSAPTAACTSSDPLLAGSDTLATARVLAAAIRREARRPGALRPRRAPMPRPGRWGPRWPSCSTCRRRRPSAASTVDPRRARSRPSARPTTASRPSPARCRRSSPPPRTSPRSAFRTRPSAQAAAAKPIATWRSPTSALAAGDVGGAGSPTWVAGVEQVDVARRGELLDRRRRPRRWRRARASGSRRSARSTTPSRARAAGAPDARERRARCGSSSRRAARASVR